MNIKRKMRFLRIRLKYTRAFWVDKNFKFLKAKDINDDYLKHILFFIAEGRGWPVFIDKKKRINRIFQEAYRRQLLNPAGILNLHQWALCIHGHSADFPKYQFTWDGKFVDLRNGEVVE